MANPYADQAKGSSKSKFKSMTGQSGGGQKFGGEGQYKGGAGGGTGRLEKARSYGSNAAYYGHKVAAEDFTAGAWSLDRRRANSWD